MIASVLLSKDVGHFVLLARRSLGRFGLTMPQFANNAEILEVGVVIETEEGSFVRVVENVHGSFIAIMVVGFFWTPET